MACAAMRASRRSARAAMERVRAKMQAPSSAFREDGARVCDGRAHEARGKK